MQTYVNCPSCGRFINLEQVEASCQLCGADMCSRCLHVCSDCGKEVCRDCWGGGNMCKKCNNIKHISVGFDKAREWKTDGDGLIGVGKLLYGTTKGIIDYSNLDAKKRERKKEREDAIRLLEAKQRKLLK